jgi:hypothetical protein
VLSLKVADPQCQPAECITGREFWLRENLIVVACSDASAKMVGSNNETSGTHSEDQPR